MAIIELKDISFSYDNEDNQVFQNLNISINKGEFTFISGDNGSGKSTLFKIINGLLIPESGSYTFEDEVITEKYLRNNKNSKTFHKKIGFLFQNPDIMLFNSTVYDEIAFGPRQMQLDEDKIKTIVNDCMNLFNIGNISDKAPYHLSGGQKKRVALASVISLNPSILVLDEPFSGLDKSGINFLVEFLKEFKSIGKTIIISSHDINPIKDLIDKTIEL